MADFELPSKRPHKHESCVLPARPASLTFPRGFSFSFLKSITTPTHHLPLHKQWNRMFSLLFFTPFQRLNPHLHIRPLIRVQQPSLCFNSVLEEEWNVLRLPDALICYFTLWSGFKKTKKTSSGTRSV